MCIINIKTTNYIFRTQTIKDLNELNQPLDGRTSLTKHWDVFQYHWDTYVFIKSLFYLFKIRFSLYYYHNYYYYLIYIIYLFVSSYFVLI